MSASAPIVEVFSSFQGEGSYAGERHLFVRFQDCELSCRWCDTPQGFVSNRFCRVEFPPFSKTFRQVPNPMTVASLNEIVSGFEKQTIAITGGEPLQKSTFLKEWLPTLPGRAILLETAGVHFRELEEIIDLVSIVSMDIKLPSSTGMKPLWEEHEAFLRIGLKKDLYVKVVVTGDTRLSDVERAVELVAHAGEKIPFILQPVTPFGKFRSEPTLEQLAVWSTVAAKRLSRVRVLPQIHKQMGIL